MDKKILNEAQYYVRINDLPSLKDLYQSLESLEYVNYIYLFRQLFNNGCLYGHLEIIQWLHGLYLEMDIAAQIGLKQIYTYGSYLSRQRQHSDLEKWLAETRKTI
jgi:hypothetical protein